MLRSELTVEPRKTREKMATIAMREKDQRVFREALAFVAAREVGDPQRDATGITSFGVDLPETSIAGPSEDPAIAVRERDPN